MSIQHGMPVGDYRLVSKIGSGAKGDAASLRTGSRRQLWGRHR